MSFIPYHSTSEVEQPRPTSFPGQRLLAVYIQVWRSRQAFYRTFLLFFLACLFVGCKSYYYNPAASLEQARQDFQECDYQKSLHSEEHVLGKGQTYREMQLMDKCMSLRGYTLLRDSAFGDDFQRLDLGMSGVAAKKEVADR